MDQLRQRVGINVYAFDLLWSIYGNQKKAPKSSNPIKFRVYLKNKPLKDLPPENDFWEYKILEGKGIWILTKLMPHLIFSKEKPDVIFSPSHYIPLITFIITTEIVLLFLIDTLDSCSSFRQ